MPMEKNLKNGAAFRPDVTREAVEALLNEGLSVSAAAKRLGCSYQTARSRLESGAKKPARPAKRGRRPMSTDEFVRRARLIHGDRSIMARSSIFVMTGRSALFVRYTVRSSRCRSSTCPGPAARIRSAPMPSGWRPTCPGMAPGRFYK